MRKDKMRIPVIQLDKYFIMVRKQEEVQKRDDFENMCVVHIGDAGVHHCVCVSEYIMYVGYACLRAFVCQRVINTTFLEI